MIYKTGEKAQMNDQVLGEVDGVPARGRVLAVRENGDILITRRAAYGGTDKPLSSEHHEVPASDFSLVYRHAPKGAVAAAVAAPAKKVAKPGAAKK